MVRGSADVEIYEIDGEHYPDSDQLAMLRPHEANEQSTFGGDSENFLVLEIRGHTYTICIDELLTAIQAMSLISKARV